jgi:hypothetical protein
MTLGKEEKKITENTVPTQNTSPKVKDEKHSHPTFLQLHHRESGWFSKHTGNPPRDILSGTI